MMRFILKALLGLAALFAIALFSLPVVLQTEAMRTSVLSHIEAATGRKVIVSKIGITLFPQAALQLENVKILNPKWLDNEDTISVRTLDIGVELMPLLHRAIVVKKITLVDPVINLVKKGNQANWQFGEEHITGSTATTLSEPVQKMDISLNQLVIKNGNFSYRDAATDKPAQSLSDISMNLTAPHLNEKVNVELQTSYGNKKINIVLQLMHPLEAMHGKATQADIKVASDIINFDFKGELAKAGNIPSIKGILMIPEIDVESFSEAKHVEQAAKPALAQQNNVSHWSDTTIKLDFLSSVNANLTVNVGKLVMEKTIISDIKANMVLNNGALKIETADIAAYNGLIKAVVQVSIAGNAGISALLKNIDLAPILHDFAQYDQISGKVNGNFTLTTTGQSQRAWISHLSGNGQFSVNDGRMKGKIVSALFQGKGSDETTFAEFSGKFAVSQGIVSNNDLKITTPLLHITGAGTINLPNYTMDYSIKPSLVAAADAKDEAAITLPLKVEGNIDNPAIRPDIREAIQEGLKNPEAIKDTARQIKDNLLNKDTIKGLLR